MLLLSTVLVAVGLFALVFALAETRVRVAGSASVIEVALGEADPDERRTSEGTSVLYRALEPVLASSARLVGRLSPRSRVDLVRRRLVLAGLEGTVTVERVLSYKAAAAVAGFLFGLLGAPGQVPTLVWALVLALLVSFVPDLLLGSRADSRQQQIGRELPEALDLLALTVEAGLGLEQALEVVVEEGTGPLASELQRMLREIELGVPRREALGSLRARTDVPELSSFVVALVQADEVGASVGETLKAQAAQVRLKRRQKAREQAAKTPVQILFPLILGIFPAIFVIAVGPGIINISENIVGR